MTTALVVFAKAPVAGFAKTRLIPALGPQGAARLAERLLDHAVREALSTRFDRVELCVTPDTSHECFARLEAGSGGALRLSDQGRGDLGERMNRALCRLLREHGKVLLMGTDAPALDAASLRAAAATLDGNDAVVVPAVDGGYALIGLTRPVPHLFRDMTWSTPQVMQETRQRAREAGLRWFELPPIADVDGPCDLGRLPAGWSS